MENNLCYKPFVSFVPHIGDRVIVRDWDAMVAEYGLINFEDVGYIRMPGILVDPNIKEACGKIMVITEMRQNSHGDFDIVEAFYGDEEYILPIYALKCLDNRDDECIEIDDELDTYLNDIQIV